MPLARSVSALTAPRRGFMATASFVAGGYWIAPGLRADEARHATSVMGSCGSPASASVARGRAIRQVPPDHTHITAAAMTMRLGKHCFCQKSLTRAIAEARTLGELGRSQEEQPFQIAPRGVLVVGDKDSLYAPGDFGADLILKSGNVPKGIAFTKSPGQFEEFVRAVKGGRGREEDRVGSQEARRHQRARSGATHSADAA